MNIVFQFVVVALITVLSATKAEVDCSDRPPFVHPSECCDISIITDDIKEKCQGFSKPTGGPPGGMDDNSEGMPGPPGVGNGPPGVNRHGHGHGHGHHHHGPHHHCFFSCVLNETGIMIDGELQEDRLNEYLNEALDDSELIDIFSNNFLKCSENMENMPIKKGPPHGHGGGRGGGHGPPHHHCPPGNGMLMACAMMKTFKECPESIWSDTEQCNNVRDYWNECHPHHSGSGDVDDVEEEEEEEEMEDYEDYEEEEEIEDNEEEI